MAGREINGAIWGEMKRGGEGEGITEKESKRKKKEKGDGRDGYQPGMGNGWKKGYRNKGRWKRWRRGERKKGMEEIGTSWDGEWLEEGIDVGEWERGMSDTV